MRAHASRRSRVRLALVTLAGIAALAAGCESVIGAHFGDAKLAVCDSLRPEAPPSLTNAGGALDVTAVLSTIDWGEDETADGTPRYGTIGYDLDGRCTSLLDPPPCKPVAWAASAVVDGARGQDNAIGLMLSRQKAAFGLAPITSPYLNQSVAQGVHAPFAVVRVSEYDGYSDDDAVKVEWFVPTTLGAADAGAIAPHFDATDVWPLTPARSTDADAGGSARALVFVDDHAYVTHSRLVAHFPAGVGFRLLNVVWSVSDAILSADMQNEAGTKVTLVHGLLAGHARMRELFPRLPDLTHSFAGQAVCTNASVYANIKRWLCSAPDSVLDHAPGADVTCDAVSFGLAFETKPATLGQPTPPSRDVPLCDPSVDPANDTCDVAPP